MGQLTGPQEINSQNSNFGAQSEFSLTKNSSAK
jgi:hypothetical protein